MCRGAATLHVARDGQRAARSRARSRSRSSDDDAVVVFLASRRGRSPQHASPRRSLAIAAGGRRRQLDRLSRGPSLRFPFPRLHREASDDRTFGHATPRPGLGTLGAVTLEHPVHEREASAQRRPQRPDVLHDEQHPEWDHPEPQNREETRAPADDEEQRDGQAVVQGARALGVGKYLAYCRRHQSFEALELAIELVFVDSSERRLGDGRGRREGRRRRREEGRHGAGAKRRVPNRALHDPRRATSAVRGRPWRSGRSERGACVPRQGRARAPPTLRGAAAPPLRSAAHGHQKAQMGIPSGARPSEA